MGKIMRGVMDIANRAKLQLIEPTELDTVQTNLSTHKAVGNTTAHTVDNIAGLRPLLDGKSYTGHTHTVADIGLPTGYTGNVSVITGINFTTQAVTTKVITVNKGVITSIV